MATDLERLAKILEDGMSRIDKEDEMAAIVPLLKVLIEDISTHKRDVSIDIRKLIETVRDVSKMPGPRGPRGGPGDKGDQGDDADPEEVAAALKRDRQFMTFIKPKEGKPGERGATPSHEWDDTKLRFQNSDGSWGPWIDLRGPRGSGSFFGGGGSTGIERLRFGSTVLEGVAVLEFAGSGVSSIAKTPNGAKVTITGGSSGGGGGIGTATEKLTGSQSGADVTLSLTGLLNEFITVVGVYRLGQLLTPTQDYAVAGATVTVYSASESEVFQVSYTYASTDIVTTATDLINGSQNGTGVELNTNSLTHSYISILGVWRQGQLLDHSSEWSQASNIITVPNADASEKFQIQYTY